MSSYVNLHGCSYPKKSIIENVNPALIFSYLIRKNIGSFRIRLTVELFGLFIVKLFFGMLFGN